MINNIILGKSLCARNFKTRNNYYQLTEAAQWRAVITPKMGLF